MSEETFRLETYVVRRVLPFLRRDLWTQSIDWFYSRKKRFTDTSPSVVKLINDDIGVKISHQTLGRLSFRERFRAGFRSV